MFKLVLLLIVIRFAYTTDTGDILEALNLLPLVERQSKSNYLENTYFPALNNYHVTAKSAKESKYPWIAEVVHSSSANIPHMCTAVCIEAAIYITAARCIYTLKVKYTTIIHMSKKFEALAFVLPSKPTKQMFDDIGFIVVNKKKAKGVKWQVIKMLNKVKRTDTTFKWFAKLSAPLGKLKYKVVGYALEKATFKAKTAATKYVLKELDVIVTHELCDNILEHVRKGGAFKVPCYHSCTFEEFKKLDKKCSNYLGVEGGAVIDTTSKKLVGIATWGTYFSKFELPVGFSVVNSDNFFKDLSCARLIREDKTAVIKEGYYQNLCDSKQKKI